MDRVGIKVGFIKIKQPVAFFGLIGFFWALLVLLFFFYFWPFFRIFLGKMSYFVKITYVYIK